MQKIATKNVIIKTKSRLLRSNDTLLFSPNSRRYFLKNYITYVPTIVLMNSTTLHMLKTVQPLEL